MLTQSLSRRSFLAATAAAPLATMLAQGKKIPLGLELYSVRNELKQDPMGTVKAVAKMGYQVVEFFAPYYDWTPQQAKDMRKLMDDLGIKCNSTHNALANYSAEKIRKAIDLNKTIGAKYVVVASAGKATTLDAWRANADKLAAGAEKLKAAGLHGGYHNHQTEFLAIEGKRPIEVIAANTPKDFMMQFDVGTCLEAKQDPVAWINANPGRIKSIHCKDWSPDKGYKVLFGDGVAPWKQILAAAEKKGGVEYYLIEQEGSDLTPLETVDKCLKNFKKIHA